MDKLPVLPMSMDDAEGASELFRGSSCNVHVNASRQRLLPKLRVKCADTKVCELHVTEDHSGDLTAWLMIGDPDYLPLYFFLASPATIERCFTTKRYDMDCRIEAILGFKFHFLIARQVHHDLEQTISESLGPFTSLPSFLALHVRELSVLRNPRGLIFCSIPERTNRSVSCLYLIGRESDLEIDKVTHFLQGHIQFRWEQR